MLQDVPLVLRLNPADDVVTARRQLVSGTLVKSEGVTVIGLVPAGDKVAVRAIAKGAPVRRYNRIIGFATRDICPGEHVHLHNLGIGEEHGANLGESKRDYAFCADAEPTAMAAPPATFMGIVRPDGRVATRNYVAILSSVNCSATVCCAIADRFRRDIFPAALADFPNVDGVIALTHGTGCGMDMGEAMTILSRTMAGYARHPNIAAVVFVGLGCEANPITSLFGAVGLADSERIARYTMQEVGGTAKAIERGVAQVKEMLWAANRVERVPVPASELMLGLQCGGSDGYSGISAHPALGNAVDRLVAHGGIAILSETPELYGAEHLSTRRAVSCEVGEKLIARIKWWEDYFARNRGERNNNPSPGNKAGGLTTILENSLGAVAKGGTTNLVDVYEYAQPVTARGLVYIDTPGYDPVSATGQVAVGANMILFTTGRCSAYGCAPSPSLKLATNTELWQRPEEDIDPNCGEINDGLASIEDIGTRLFDLIIATASEAKTKSEEFGYGQSEFVPWQVGATM